MEANVPEGFVAWPLGGGFAEAFGPVYVNHAARAMGFWIAPRHLNPVGVCNGGAMATFADMQIAAVIVGSPGTSEGHQPTISLQVDYLATAPLGAWVQAAVTLVKTTKTLIFTQALFTADADIVARSQAIYRNYGRGVAAGAASAESKS